MSKQQWYVFKDQQQKGPFSWEQLWQMARSGAVGPADYYWTAGMAGWRRGDQMPELFPGPAAAPPPPPAFPPSMPGAAAPPSAAQSASSTRSVPAAAPAATASTASSFYQQQKGDSGPFSNVPAERKGRGFLFFFTILILILVLLAAGGYYLYRFYLPEGEKLAARLPLPFLGGKEEQDGAGAYPLVGAWYGKSQFPEEEGYLRFNTDGTLNLASPAEGWWTTVEYRLQQEEEIFYLEVYNSTLEEWERVAVLEQVDKDTLFLTAEGETTIELRRISDQQFQKVINDLTFQEIF